MLIATDDYLRVGTSPGALLFEGDVQVVFFLGAQEDPVCPSGVQASVVALREDFDASLALELLLSMLKRGLVCCLIGAERLLDEFSRLYLWRVYGLDDEEATIWLRRREERAFF